MLSKSMEISNFLNPYKNAILTATNENAHVIDRLVAVRDVLPIQNKLHESDKKALAQLVEELSDAGVDKSISRALEKANSADYMHYEEKLTGFEIYGEYSFLTFALIKGKLDSAEEILGRRRPTMSTADYRDAIYHAIATGSETMVRRLYQNGDIPLNAIITQPMKDKPVALNGLGLAAYFQNLSLIRMFFEQKDIFVNDISLMSAALKFGRSKDVNPAVIALITQHPSLNLSADYIHRNSVKLMQSKGFPIESIQAIIKILCQKQKFTTDKCLWAYRQE